MRRGLMAWDAEEIPLEALKERARRLQSAMAAHGQDAMILYTNFVRSAAVSHLTAFSPYWADAVLLVPRQGELVFATTLSKRVGNWIQSVKPVGELVHSPAPAAVLAKRLAAEAGVKCVAILERDAFPAGLYDELAAALPAVELVDGSEAFAAARGHLDEVERRLLKKAAAIAAGALENLNLENLNPDLAAHAGDAVGAVEKYARLNGAEEVYVAAVPDLDADRRFVRVSGKAALGRRFALRATVAYKGAWVRQAKTYSRDEADRLALKRAYTWFKGFLARLDVDRPLGPTLAASLADISGAHLVSWLAEAPRGTSPLAVVASPQNPEAALRQVPALVVSVGLTIGGLTIDGMPWCGAGLASLAHSPAHGKPG